MLLDGRQRWRLYPEEEIGKLGPHFGDDLTGDDMTFLWREKNPLYPYAKRYEIELTPGDLLLIPTGYAYEVENLEPSVVVTGRYVDHLNWQAYEASMRTKATLSKVSQP